MSLTVIKVPVTLKSEGTPQASNMDSAYTWESAIKKQQELKYPPPPG